MKYWSVLVVSFVIFPSVVFANGYKILCVKSAKATAMGEAFIVQADDPSAVTLNPAGVSQLEGSQVNLQGTLCNSYTEYKSEAGDKTDSKDKWEAVPAFYVTSDMGTKNMGFGFGVSYPNGLSKEWGDDSFARYVSTYSQLIVADISPVYSIKLSDHFALGGGLDYYHSTAEMKQMVDMGAMRGAPGTMDVESKLEGTGDAWGYNFGGILTINEHHGFAVTYRQPYSIDYDGDVTIGNTEYDMDSTIDFPRVVVAGYAYRPNKKWKFEMDIDWTEWDSVGNMVVHYDQPGMADTTMEQDFHNTFAYKFGTEYSLAENWDLRAGYIYNENATAEHTWSPNQPDTDMQFITTGFGYHKDSIVIDAAFQLVFYRTREIDKDTNPNNPYATSINGTYKTIAPCFSLSATYMF